MPGHSQGFPRLLGRLHNTHRHTQLPWIRRKRTTTAESSYESSRTPIGPAGKKIPGERPEPNFREASVGGRPSGNPALPHVRAGRPALEPVHSAKRAMAAEDEITRLEIVGAGQQAGDEAPYSKPATAENVGSTAAARSIPASELAALGANSNLHTVFPNWPTGCAKSSKLSPQSKKLRSGRLAAKFARSSTNCCKSTRKFKTCSV